MDGPILWFIAWRFDRIYDQVIHNNTRRKAGRTQEIKDKSSFCQSIHYSGRQRELLPEELASQFHRTVAQLLFLCMRARPDIQTVVSFLTTRGKSRVMDDWGKL